MPPVLTKSSANYDNDYDTVQPLFFLDGEEEDFYPPPRSQLLPGPSEDIWKKFELLPTPPLSPSRRPSLSDVPLSAADHLEAVSDLLDEDCNPSAAYLQSFIIQDCMWSSSFAATTKLEKVVSERLALLRSRRDSLTTTAATTTNNTNSIPDRAADQQVDRSQVTTGYLQDLHTDCIDPSVVFPYTSLSEKSDGGAAMGVGSELCLDSPPLSSSDSESEEEEGPEEEEDEEIDVVTVDRRKASQRSDASPLVLKRSHINIHQHNYAAPQPAAPCKQPAVKRAKSEIACLALRQSGGRRCWSPRSDGEDTDDKRRTHNVLERQRRNELKMSFLALRDEIPAVANNDKAAKVVILKKATEFIVEIREDERRLLTMKDELRKRSRELKHRLEQLRTLH
ncbi:transcriptional regulator Myc-B-like [Xiphias gladius]|uniref:transcriptional regulator Myc-B-like n=1 Tax=Xiphias gladius TaxID=8245 RepID=UPI001A9A177A|nr:transcriptional regulator Myc-B-like [Xiphias gladius]XP_040001897.1 transcriptional regulator Myc-B-like [Xiphias gladius]XP_040001898.1 transcriptional regulator Myc-B-like [Xiphias gladius]XP_040001899.1 transcriptional regulator Myc-B-like [Xiphias gladius]XP_040001900.1 transcriptional regulator Myc-B-like [Xiphias gladius]XP_040001901.1 transcriptional regulator Myc-B-like [Xiphias gladius]